MICHVLDNLAMPNAKFILLARKEHYENETETVNWIKKHYNVEFVLIDKLTEGAMYSMLCHVLKCKLPYLAAYADNGGICVFSYRSGRWVLNKWNETGRLEPEA